MNVSEVSVVDTRNAVATTDRGQPVAVWAAAWIGWAVRIVVVTVMLAASGEVSPAREEQGKPGPASTRRAASMSSPPGRADTAATAGP